MKYSRLITGLTLTLAAALGACQTTTPTEQGPEVQIEREAEYQQCLQDNMAVAMAWEAIERMCREKVSKPTSLLPEPDGS